MYLTFDDPSLIHPIQGQRLLRSKSTFNCLLTPPVVDSGGFSVHLSLTSLNGEGCAVATVPYFCPTSSCSLFIEMNVSILDSSTSRIRYMMMILLCSCIRYISVRRHIMLKFRSYNIFWSFVDVFEQGVICYSTRCYLASSEQTSSFTSYYHFGCDPDSSNREGSVIASATFCPWYISLIQWCCYYFCFYNDMLIQVCYYSR